MTKLGEAKPGQTFRLILEDRGLIHPVHLLCSICLFFREPDQDSMDSERREDGFVLRYEEVGGEFRDFSAGFLHQVSAKLR